jgi:small subunit ribosomal protein S20
MPHTRSAKKNHRRAEKRRLHNRAVIKSIKTQVKKFLEVLADEPVEKAQEEFNAAAKKLDKAGAKRIIHPNKSARLKSQLARKLHAKKTKPAAPASGS